MEHPELKKDSYKTESASDAAGAHIFYSSDRGATASLRWLYGRVDLPHASMEKRTLFLTGNSGEAAQIAARSV